MILKTVKFSVPAEMRRSTTTCVIWTSDIQPTVEAQHMSDNMRSANKSVEDRKLVVAVTKNMEAVISRRSSEKSVQEKNLFKWHTCVGQSRNTESTAVETSCPSHGQKDTLWSWWQSSFRTVACHHQRYPESTGLLLWGRWTTPQHITALLTGSTKDLLQGPEPALPPPLGDGLTPSLTELLICDNVLYYGDIITVSMLSFVLRSC